MATRFTYKALATATLGIALSLLFGGTSTTSAASSSTTDELLLDPPSAPSHCRTGHFTIRDRRKGDYTIYYVSWRDNSTNEDGFTLETWWRNESGVWVLAWSEDLAANTTRAGLGGRPGPDYKFRV